MLKHEKKLYKTHPNIHTMANKISHLRTPMLPWILVIIPYRGMNYTKVRQVKRPPVLCWIMNLIIFIKINRIKPIGSLEKIRDLSSNVKPGKI